jgi:hypothetical protein
VSRDGQTFKVASTTYLVVEELPLFDLDLPYSNVGHRIVSLTTGKTLKVSEAYLADLEEKGKRLT